jgi:hypothetical protein
MEAREAAEAKNGFVQHAPASCTGIHMACGAVSVRINAQDGRDLLEGEEGQLLDALKVLPTLCAEMSHIYYGQIQTTFMWSNVAWPSPRSDSVPSAHKRGEAGVKC